MDALEAKKHEYWNHFVAEWFTSSKKSKIVTGPRLAKAKPVMWRDTSFWWDILERHDGLRRTPEQMRTETPEIYDHCSGNFWSSVMGEIHRQNEYRL